MYKIDLALNNLICYETKPEETIFNSINLIDKEI